MEKELEDSIFFQQWTAHRDQYFVKLVVLDIALFSFPIVMFALYLIPIAYLVILLASAGIFTLLIALLSVKSNPPLET